MTFSATVAETPSCSFTATSWVPSALIGLATTIVRLSTFSPDVSESAVGDLADGHRTEQTTTGTGAHLDGDGLGLELGLDLLGVAEVADGARGASSLDRLDLLLATAGPPQREATGDEVVAAVAVLHLDDVAGGTETGDFLGQDELHVVSSLQRPVDV